MRSGPGGARAVRAWLVGVALGLGAGGGVWAGGQGEGRARAPIRFEDVTAARGLPTQRGKKYGGPLVADLDQDGDYDLFLGHHDGSPALVLWNRGDGTYAPPVVQYRKRDIHGTSAGDLDLDGDLDLLVSLGGWMGTRGRPPEALLYEGGRFRDATDEVGLTAFEGRGRAVLPADLDNDGDLDLLLVQSAPIRPSDPRHLVLENRAGVFWLRPETGLEGEYAERALVRDLDGDGNKDVLFFSPVALFRGDGKMGFRDVTREVFPADLAGLQDVMAVADLDLEADGDRDLYLARGLADWQMSEDLHEFDPELETLALRDRGSSGGDGLEFSAPGGPRLSGLSFHVRGRREVVWAPLFVGSQELRTGAEEELRVTPAMAAGPPVPQDREGWYLRHLGEGRWRLDWRFTRPTWVVRATIQGVVAVDTKWPEPDLERSDRLLEYRDGRYVDVSRRAGIPRGGNHQGVTVGDLDNDGHEDLVVFRYGGLRSRLPDFLLRSRGDGTFAVSTAHGMRHDLDDGQGEMGQAFDQDLDGRLDILLGNAEGGRWHLFRNTTSPSPAARGLLVSVGGLAGPILAGAALGAVVTAEVGGRTLTREVGTAGISRTQSHHGILHFGLGEHAQVDRITVRWTNGREQALVDVPAEHLVRFPLALEREPLSPLRSPEARALPGGLVPSPAPGEGGGS